MNPGEATSQDAAPVARIGPNAVTRMAEALREDVGIAETARLFAAASLAHHLDAPPEHMVDEREVTALHRVVRRELGLERAASVARDAGRRTGDYLLAVRIPKPAQRILRILPRRLASHVLLTAIGRHAWTFAGSGEFRAEAAWPARIVIFDSPLCRGARADIPLCDYYAATFERIYRALIDRDAVATEIACAGRGDPACVFEVR